MAKYTAEEKAKLMGAAVGTALTIIIVYWLHLETVTWRKKVVTICERQLVEQLRTHHHETSPTVTCRRDEERGAVCITMLRGEAAYFQCNGFGFALPMSPMP